MFDKFSVLCSLNQVDRWCIICLWLSLLFILINIILCYVQNISNDIFFNCKKCPKRYIFSLVLSCWFIFLYFIIFLSIIIKLPVSLGYNFSSWYADGLYCELTLPESNSVSLTWVCRDRHIINLPFNLLVEGDVILIGPSSKAPATCKQVITSFFIPSSLSNTKFWWNYEF